MNKRKNRLIDFDKFICSLFAQGVFPDDGRSIRNNVLNALKDQNLEYYGGSIVPIGKGSKQQSDAKENDDYAFYKKGDFVMCNNTEIFVFDKYELGGLIDSYVSLRNGKFQFRRVYTLNNYMRLATYDEINIFFEEFKSLCGKMDRVCSVFDSLESE